MIERVLAVYFRHRSTALLCAAIPPSLWVLQSPAELSPAEFGGAVALVAAGVSLRLSAVRQLGKGARVHRAHATAGLSTAGPFAWSRNPLYLAAALMVTGVGVLAGGGSLALLLLPATIALYTPIVSHEEQTLTALFGEDYSSYRQQAARWFCLPGRSAPHAEVGQTPWPEVMRREWRLVPGMVAAIFGVAAVRAGILPLEALLDLAADWFLIPTWVLLLIGFGVGAVVNSLLVERKFIRHSRRRAANRSAALPQRAPLGGVDG